MRKMSLRFEPEWISHKNTIELELMVDNLLMAS